MAVALALAGLALLVAGGWVLLLALAGRSASPPRERVAVPRWSLRDLSANARSGAADLSEFTW
jgi:hypothetical protein